MTARILSLLGLFILCQSCIERETHQEIHQNTIFIDDYGKHSKYLDINLPEVDFAFEFEDNGAPFLFIGKPQKWAQEQLGLDADSVYYEFEGEIIDVDSIFHLTYNDDVVELNVVIDNSCTWGNLNILYTTEYKYGLMLNCITKNEGYLRFYKHQIEPEFIGFGMYWRDWDLSMFVIQDGRMLVEDSEYVYNLKLIEQLISGHRNFSDTVVLYNAGSDAESYKKVYSYKLDADSCQNQIDYWNDQISVYKKYNVDPYLFKRQKRKWFLRKRAIELTNCKNVLSDMSKVSLRVNNENSIGQCIDIVSVFSRVRANNHSILFKELRTKMSGNEIRELLFRNFFFDKWRTEIPQSKLDKVNHEFNNTGYYESVPSPPEPDEEVIYIDEFNIPPPPVAN